MKTRDKTNDVRALNDEQLDLVSGGVVEGGCILLPKILTWPFPVPKDIIKKITF